jgi:hypothetical protein
VVTTFATSSRARYAPLDRIGMTGFDGQDMRARVGSTIGRDNMFVGMVIFFLVFSFSFFVLLFSF